MTSFISPKHHLALRSCWYVCGHHFNKRLKSGSIPTSFGKTGLHTPLAVGSWRRTCFSWKWGLKENETGLKNVLKCCCVTVWNMLSKSWLIQLFTSNNQNVCSTSFHQLDEREAPDWSYAHFLISYKFGAGIYVLEMNLRRRMDKLLS